MNDAGHVPRRWNGRTIKLLSIAAVLVGVAAACSPPQSQPSDQPEAPLTSTTNVQLPTPTSLDDTNGRGESTSTTSTTSPSSGATSPSTTTVTSSSQPSTNTTNASTTSAPVNHPPSITITSPINLSRHEAVFDPLTSTFRAPVSMSAEISDPDGDDVTVDWFSSEGGYLGTGVSISASLVSFVDSSQPFITAVATDARGAQGDYTIQVSVWVPSDT